MESKSKLRIAHFSGPNATIQNTPPLVTSNKARRRYNLPLLKNPDGTVSKFDALRAQRLAAPVRVYIEQFSAHPLEQDAAELYAPADGFVGVDGVCHRERRSASDKPVYEVELLPEDGVYPLPYMARQADGQAWEEECAAPNAPADKARQGFFPDGSRSFAEIDRLSVGADGRAGVISSLAEVDFYRLLPPSGYTKGCRPSIAPTSGKATSGPRCAAGISFPTSHATSHRRRRVPRSPALPTSRSASWRAASTTARS
jgi:hypothetical protein